MIAVVHGELDGVTCRIDGGHFDQGTHVVVQTIVKVLGAELLHVDIENAIAEQAQQCERNG